MRVLITRPQPGADRTASRLASLGHTPIILPLFEAFHFPDTALQALSHPCSAIIVTSAEVFRALNPIRDRVRPLFTVPVFAVGNATQTAAIEFGFIDVLAGSSGGAELAKMIFERYVNKKIGKNLLYLAGSPRSHELEEGLGAHQIQCRTETIYEMRPNAITEADIREVFSNTAPEAILFYSAEAARRFFSLATGNGNADILHMVRFLCLSRNIAAVVPQSLRNQVEISAAADETSLLDLLSQA